MLHNGLRLGILLIVVYCDEEVISQAEPVFFQPQFVIHPVLPCPFCWSAIDGQVSDKRQEKNKQNSLNMTMDDELSQ